MKVSLLLVTVMLAGTVSPVFARIGEYGSRQYTRVGHHDEHRDEHHDWDRHDIDRRGGFNWGGALIGGLIGAAAGYAMGSAGAPPAPVVVAPPAVGTYVPALPGYCAQVPAAYGGVVYNCGGIFYQPVYNGMSMMYEVVPGP